MCIEASRLRNSTVQSGEPAVSQLGSARYSIPRRKWRTYGQKNKSELRPTQSKYALQDTLPDSQNDFSVDDMHDVVSDVWHETCEGEHFSDLNASSDTLSDGWPEIYHAHLWTLDMVT